MFRRRHPTCRRLRALGLRIAIFTDGEQSHQQLKLDLVGLREEVDLMICSSRLPAGKPDLRAFGAAVSRLGVPAAEILMVGDSLEKDVRGALDAGLDAVLLDRHDEHPDAQVRRIRTLDALNPWSRGQA